MEHQQLYVIQQRIRSGLQKHGTNVLTNDRDPQGDGDQSTIPKPESHRQFYREIFSEGGDLTEWFCLGKVSKFGVSCVSGDVATVQAMLEEASKQSRSSSGHPPSEALIKLLETRETSMRLSPLLMIVSAGKNISNDYNSNSGDDLSGNQIRIAELLLKYGARPDAKDVCGKTVVHYGAGAMATDMTMAVVERASEAYKTSYMFHQEIELTGLKNSASKNGRRGVALGFQWSNKRRLVYLYDEKKQLAIKPENIRVVGMDNNKTTDSSDDRKLCNIQCRLGTISLLETIPAKRSDVADFLINTLGASIDIADLDGCSARSMSMVGMAEMASPAVTVIKEAARKQGKASAKADRRKCANCGTPEPSDKKFRVCSRCHQIRYCGRDCQVEHWKAQHKKECKNLEVMSEVGIKLEKPPSTGQFVSMINLGTGQASAPARDSEGFRKPTNIAVDEKFYVKCQGGGPTLPIMIYDETRQCNFSYPPGLVGFEEIRAKINAEPAFQGRKTYMKASFDSAGVCTIYPTTAKLKRW